MSAIVVSANMGDLADRRTWRMDGLTDRQKPVVDSTVLDTGPVVERPYRLRSISGLELLSLRDRENQFPKSAYQG